MRLAPSPVFLLFLLAMLAACATAPERPDAPPPTIPAGEPPPDAAGAPEAPEPVQSPREIARLVEERLQSEMLVPRGSAGPLLVDTGEVYLGIALGPTSDLVWRLDGTDFAAVPVEGEIQPETFTPRAIDLSRRNPQGFQVRLRTIAGDEDLFVLDAGQGDPSVVQTVASATTRSELRDADLDGMAELVQYALIFEAPGRRELLVDLLEWREGSFVHRASVPLLRRLNQRLADLQRMLTDPTSAPDRLARLAAALTPIEGAPDPRTLLPAAAATVPPINELALELDESSWRIIHEIALMPGPAIYRIEIDLIANPALADPVRIVGLDN